MALKIKTYTLTPKADSRGWLIENELPIVRRSMRHFLVSTSKPGVVRGQHYHTQKREWFLVLGGRATITFEDIKTKDRVSVDLDQKSFRMVEIPPNVAHAIVNKGRGAMMLLGIVNEHFDLKHPDTFPYKVI